MFGLSKLKLKDSIDKIKEKNCEIEIFGLGYVGFPITVRLASAGYTTRGIDIDIKRINRLKQGILLESEKSLKQQFDVAINQNKLHLSGIPKVTDLPKIGIICVPTPIPTENTRSDTYVKKAVNEFLKTSKRGDLIILESSVEIGTTENICSLVSEKGFTLGDNFGVCFCPERIDPQNKKWNLENIPRVIYCTDDASFEISKIIYSSVNDSNLMRVIHPRTAEVVKSYENAFRLVNISLVNELALLCNKLGISVNEVIKAASTKPFGFMPFYPSAGAGGHCIPKDPLFLSESAKKFGLELTSIESAISINRLMPKYIANIIEDTINRENLEKSVLICGLTYKPDIEDMRDSPGFKLLNEFKRKKFQIFVHDPYYNDELQEKYLKENHIDVSFERIHDLDNESLKKNWMPLYCTISY